MFLVREEVARIHLTVIHIGQQRCIAEQEHRSGDEPVAEIAERSGECGLCQLDPFQITVQGAREQDTECRAAADDDRRHENTEHSGKPLVHRMLDIRRRVHGRSRSGACIIAEQPSCDAIAECLLYRVAERPARRLLNTECGVEDKAEHIGNPLSVRHEHDERKDDIGECHEGNDVGRDGGQSFDAAEDNERRKDHEHCPDTERRERGLTAERPRDGVALYHAVNDAVAENDRDRKEDGEHAGVQPSSHVVCGTSAKRCSILVSHTEHLREYRLTEHDGHTEDGRYPHPKDRAGTARGERRCNADETARTDFAADGRAERAECTDACRVAAGLPEIRYKLGEVPYLRHAEADRVENTA